MKMGWEKISKYLENYKFYKELFQRKIVESLKDLLFTDLISLILGSNAKVRTRSFWIFYENSHFFLHILIANIESSTQNTTNTQLRDTPQ